MIKKNDSIFNIKYDKSFQILKLALDNLKEKYRITSGEILSLIEQRQVSKEILLPVPIFEVSGLSALEAICKYLKEESGFSFSKIALLLNRDSRTIWTSYSNAARKRKERLPAKESKFFIPASIFTDRKFSVLEAIVSCLKEKFSLRYSEISVLLNRDERNIWTAYNRAKKKKK